MLLDYDKKATDKNFSYLGSVDVGTKYPRSFWKENSSGRPVCYWAISSKYNKDEMALVHDEISDRITSISFAERTTKTEEPLWRLTGIDEDGLPKSETYSHSDMANAFSGSKLLDMPFALGKNFWDRYGNIEATVPKGSELPELSKKIF